ncbi:hypothetical protein HID58_081978 [Brassica napus]|uniref:Uncharacterized protein n=1 Tax=Brassica napus TaxID=3708 RepID=A0ABQ7Y9C7_BRANA|nr:hypothetical protein HID58_081978 [Brassica napus]
MIIKHCNNVKSSRSPIIPTNYFSMEVSLYLLDFIPLTCIYTPPQSVRCIVYLFCFAELLGFVQKLSSNHGNFSDPELKAGRCKQSLQTRLFCFWEGWNYKKGKGSERIGVDMVLIDHNQHPPLPNFELNGGNDHMSGARAIKKKPPALNTIHLNNGGCTANVNATSHALPVYIPI